MLERIDHDGEMRVTGLKGSSKALFIAALHALTGRALAVLCAGAEEARTLAQDTAFFAGADSVLLMPPWDLMLPDALSSQKDVEIERIRVLSTLIENNPSIVIIPRAALLQKVVPRGVVAGFIAPVSIGDTIDRDLFAATLTEGGYRRVPLVEEGGDFSLRGNVIDVYPPTAPGPYRLLLEGDEIESIREMDITSQRSREGAHRIHPHAGARAHPLGGGPPQGPSQPADPGRRAGAARPGEGTPRRDDRHRAGGLAQPQFFPLFYTDEAGTGGLESLADYFPAGGLIIIDDPLATARADEKARGEISRLFVRAKEEEKFRLDEDVLFLSEKDAERSAGGRQTIVIEGIEIGAHQDGSAVRFGVETDLGLRPKEPALIQREESLLAPMAERIRGWTAKSSSSIICHSEEVCTRGPSPRGLLAPHGALGGPLFPGAPGATGSSQESRAGRKMAGRFSLPGLSGSSWSAGRSYSPKRPAPPPRPFPRGMFLPSFSELDGDSIVHTDHGIGWCRGLAAQRRGDRERLPPHGIPSEQPLYIPVHRLDQIRTYIGPTEHTRMDG